MSKNTGDGELEELKDRAEKMLYDLFYKGLNAGEDTVLQYQFDHELAVKIRYVERCVKGAKDELADILTIFTEKAAQEANKADKLDNSNPPPQKLDMSSPSSAEIREAIAEMMGWYRRDGGWFQPQAPDHWNKDNDLDVTNVMSGLLALFQSQQQQLLQGLMEQKKEFESRIDDVPVYLHAVPVSVIQNKLEGLS